MQRGVMILGLFLLFGACASVNLGAANTILMQVYDIPTSNKGAHWKTNKETLRDNYGNDIDKNFIVYYRLKKLGYNVRFRTTFYECPPCRKHLKIEQRGRRLEVYYECWDMIDVPRSSIRAWVELNWQGKKYILDATANPYPIDWSSLCYSKMEVNRQKNQHKLQKLIKRERCEDKDYHYPN